MVECSAIIYICSLNEFNWNENVKIDSWKYKEWKKIWNGGSRLKVRVTLIDEKREGKSFEMVWSCVEKSD